MGNSTPVIPVVRVVLSEGTVCGVSLVPAISEHFEFFVQHWKHRPHKMSSHERAANPLTPFEVEGEMEKGLSK